MCRLIETELAAAGHAMRVMRPKPWSEIGVTNSTPVASRSATVASTSSHIRKSSWRPLSSGAVG